MLEEIISKCDEIMNYHETQMFRYHEEQIQMIQLYHDVHESLNK